MAVGLGYNETIGSQSEQQRGSGAIRTIRLQTSGYRNHIMEISVVVVAQCQ